MLLKHPITNLKCEAEVKMSGSEYLKIKFSDGYIITDEEYIYDILYVSDKISTEEYNNKFWDKTISYENMEII